jgi:peroxiredoxin
MAVMTRPLIPLLLFSSLLFASGELSNRPAPDFHLPDSKGRTVSLADFKGKPVLIEFLSTGCPHCQKFAPVLEAVHSKLKGRVAVVSIAAYPDNGTTVGEFVQTFKVSYPILYDPENTAAMAYLKPEPPKYSFSIPHLFVVDASGYIRDDFIQNTENAELFTPGGLSRLLAAYVGPK